MGISCSLDSCRSKRRSRRSRRRSICSLLGLINRLLPLRPPPPGQLLRAISRFLALRPWPDLLRNHGGRGGRGGLHRVLWCGRRGRGLHPPRDLRQPVNARLEALGLELLAHVPHPGPHLGRQRVRGPAGQGL
ncbi:hypothetical protein AAY473_019857 [Plecturocebus cupreus]